MTNHFYRRGYFAILWALLVALFYVCFSTGYGVVSSEAGQSSGSNLLATGRGFNINSDYLAAVGDFYSVASVSASMEDYLQAALKIKVFAAEARNLGLDSMEIDFSRYINGEGEVGTGAMVALLEDVAMAEAFSAQKLGSYPVDEIVIHSYYYSYPNRFEGESGLLPLDDILRERVRVTIVDTISKRVTDGIYNELKEKYEINVVR